MTARWLPPHRFEDFTVGALIAHRQRRRLTDADNLLFARLSGHEHPSLFAYAEPASGRARALPFLVLSICGGMAVRATSKHAIANLGWTYIRFPTPAYVGDVLRSLTRIEDKRLSQTDPARGIVTIVTFGIREDDSIVLEAKRSFLIATGASDPAGARPR